MKKIVGIVIRIIIMVGAFIATTMVVNKFENRTYKNLAVEMEDSKIPLAYIRYSENTINCMHGYTSNVDITMLRDSITPIDENKHVQFFIEDFGSYGTSYGYELRSIAGGSLIESGDLAAVKNENGMTAVDVSIRMDIQKDMEYMLVLIVNHNSTESAKYYTRVVINDDYHAADILGAVERFNEATFDFEAYEDDSIIKTYTDTFREKNGIRRAKDVELGHVSLANTYEDIMWNGIMPSILTSYVPKIKEIDVNYAVVELDYTVENVKDDLVTYYKVKEFYRASYDSEAGIEVMNFDRYVEEYFNREEIVANTNSYEIGVMPDDDVEFRFSSDSKKLAFVRQGQLWLYDYKAAQISLVYGFWLDDVENVRNTFDNYDINIISLDDDGNLYFTVYGYMNRDVHEGKLGIDLYSYNHETEEIEELIFIDNDYPYQAMKEQMGRLTYYDGENFYFMLGSKINCVNVSDKQMSTFVDSISMDNVYVSANREVMAYQASDNEAENDKITLVNLKTGATYEMKAAAGECLKGQGFSGTNFLYTAANTSMATYVEEGESIPASKLIIVNSDGEMVKNYSKDGVYITGIEIDTDMIYINRGVAAGTKIVETDNDFITFKEDVDNTQISVVNAASAEGINKCYFKFPPKVYMSYKPKIQITKHKEKSEPINLLVDIEDQGAKYMVYDNLGLSGLFDIAGDAINYAMEVSGIVVSKEGEVVYRKSESLEYNTIASAIFHYSSGSVDGSLKDCIYMVLTYQGVTIDYEDIGEIQDADETLTHFGKYEGMNITGLGLNLVFGYVSNGVPVISRIDDGRYVLIVSYNSEAIRYYDPVLDQEVKTSRKDYEKRMAKCNNELYTYVYQ